MEIKLERDREIERCIKNSDIFKNKLCKDTNLVFKKINK